MSAREAIEEIMFSLATASRIVEPPEVGAALDAYRDELWAEPSELRVRNAILRQTHEAVRTRLGVLLPICGIQLRNPVEAEPGSEVTCPFCNGTEKPIDPRPA